MNGLKPFILFICLVFLQIFPLVSTAQTTEVETHVEEEPIGVEPARERPVSEPARATLLSAALPGLGQIYNRKYWKVPIIYAGFGAIVYFVGINNDQYQMFRAAYIARIDGNPNTVDDFPLHSTDVLQRAMNLSRRNLEVTYLLGAALYLLNILDANVDAHLMDFDVGEKLSFGIQPLSTPQTLNTASYSLHTGLSIRIRF